MKWILALGAENRSVGQKAKRAVLADRSVLESIAKSIVVLRMIFVFPIVQNWAEHGFELFEIVILLLLLTESFVALWYWDSVHPFVAEHPIVMGIDILLSVLVLGTSGSASPFFLYLGATAVFIGLAYKGRNRLILGSLTVCAFVLIPLAMSVQAEAPTFSLPEHMIPVVVSLVVLILLMYFGAWLHGIQKKIDTVIELAARNARDAALGEERSRIARELHDSTVKSLMGIKLASDSIVLNPQNPRPRAKAISYAADTAVKQSREILSSLRSKASPPLAESMSAMVEELQVIHQLPIHLDIQGDDIPAEARYHTRKIAEEAITNAAMHSGTESIDVRMGFESDDSEVPGFFVEVKDYGRGFRPTKQREGHIGMASMRERAAEIGGTVSITSVSGSGTTVKLRIPLSEERETADEIAA